MWLRGADVWVEAESFRDKGGWVLDQQFMDLMGSPYLMAHGMGQPVADARTTVRFDQDGTYHVYVRTYNWTSPWHDGEGPGAFTLSVNGHRAGGTLGTAGDAWQWQPAGRVRVRAGEATLALHDLTGFDGRCDAIYFTTDPATLPPAGGDALAAFRRGKVNPAAHVATHEGYDLVVAGGGVAGICAALGRTAGLPGSLVNDRPVLGGCNSSEVRVTSEAHRAGRYKQLGNLIKEIAHAGRQQPADYYEDDKNYRP